MGGDYTGNTEHGTLRGAERKFTPLDVEQAIESAKSSGQVTFQIGKYGTPQTVYTGSNGLTVVLETVGRNAGKLITAWWSRE